MKLICLEEHRFDAPLAEATKPALERRFPYAGGLGSRYQDDPGASHEHRPLLQPPRISRALLDGPIEERLAAMDANGIDVQVRSYTEPTQFAPTDRAADLARAANDHLAEVVARHPGRFAGFATLPWQDPDAAMIDIERATRDLGLVATMLAGRPPRTRWSTTPATTRCSRASRSSAARFTSIPACRSRPCSSHYSGFDAEVTARMLLTALGWHNEAGIQVIRLILSGAFDRHSGLQVISGHWGGTVPFFLQRLDDVMPPAVTGLARTIGQTYRDQVFVTPSGLLYTPHFEFIRATLGVDRILFSVDYPYLTLTGARDWLSTLAIGDGERAAIAHGNAKRILRW